VPGRRGLSGGHPLVYREHEAGWLDAIFRGEATVKETRGKRVLVKILRGWGNFQPATITYTGK